MSYFNGFLRMCLAMWSLNGTLTTEQTPSTSCVNRCGDTLNRALACQCNNQCVRFNDCCSDYASVCQGATTPLPACHRTIAEVSSQMWNNDVNRIPQSAIQLNYQTQLARGDNTDRAVERLFTYLDESRLATPTYQAFMRLMDNYDPVRGVAEVTTPEKTEEINHFLDVVLATDVMGILLDHLRCLGVVQTQDDLRAKLYKMWFAGYPRRRNSVINDTSGFEHVMVGEFKTAHKINGFHNWLSFYLKEKVADLNYRGYERRAEPNLIGSSFVWDGRQKYFGSFMVGSSPEFEMAIFSLCYLTPGQSRSPINLDGHHLNVQTYKTGQHVATAYFDFL